MSIVAQSDGKKSQLRTGCPTSVNRPPAYLYLRGNIYYFRYTLSQTDKIRFNHSEVRVSLRTGFLHEARKRAKKLRESLEGRLSDFNLQDWEKLKAPLIETLEEWMDSCPEKKPLGIVEIRNRMDTFLNTLMDKADSQAKSPADDPLFQAGVPKGTPIGKMLDIYLRMHQEIVNKPELLKAAYYPNVIFLLLTANVITLEELTQDSIVPILNEFHKKIHIARNRIMKARLEGDYTYERAFYPKDEQNNPAPDSTPPLPINRTLILSDFIDNFINTKIADGNWTERNVPTHRERIKTLIDILGDIPVSSIDRKMMREFREILKKLPPNRTRVKKYKDKSIVELLNMDIKTTLNIKTINTILETISGMFEWGIREGLIENNPAKGLTLKDDRQEIELRNPFTITDINKIFFSGQYTREMFSNPAYYWVPLIGLYTGMRLEEICQLHVEDIYQDDGIWLFDIREESRDGLQDKILKTKNANRRIPIHQDLIKLGLIDYRDKTVKESLRLFPKLNKTDKSPKYGKQVGKQFSTLLKKHGITDNKSFHSLRHTFSDYFKKLNMQNDLFRQVFGHEASSLAAKQYGSKFSIKQCYDELISKLDWGMK